MIYTRLENLGRSRGICPALDTAIAYLEKADLTALAPGRNEVDGDNVYINRLDYETIPEESAVWEGHEQYGDIHIMTKGREQIGVTDVSALTRTVYKPENDFIGYEGPVRVRVPMEQGDILIVFPEDGHLVKVLLGESMPVTRLVVKFRV